MAPVAHGDCNCTLGIGLTDDVLVEVRDNFLGRHVVVELGSGAKVCFRGYVEWPKADASAQGSTEHAGGKSGCTRPETAGYVQ